MKKIILNTLLIFWIFSINAQNVNWAKSAIGNRLDEGNGIAIDNSGNTYITGQYESSTLNFGAVSITNNSTNNDADAFVAKFDVSGNCLWAKTIGGIADEYGSAISVDHNGNVFVTGYFVSSSITIGTQTLTNYGDKDVFLVKLNTNGDIIWAKNAGGNYDDEAFGVSCDGIGNVYLTGYYWSSSMNFGSSSISSNGNVDAFLAKYNSDGTLEWAKSVGGNGDDQGLAIKSDNDGNIYLTGVYESASVNFGVNTLTNSESYKKYLYVAKYNSSGTNLWAKSAFSTGANTYGSSISIDQSGNCYVGGTTDGTTANFGTFTITNNHPGGSNALIAKYNSSGTEQWVSNAVSGPEGNQTYCITTDNSGNSYISGWFTSPTVSFGGIVLNSSAYGDNIFLVKYSASGQVTNAYGFSGGGMSGGYGNGICSDNSGNAYLTGYFEGTNMTFGTTTLTNTGSYDVYWTKISVGSSGVIEDILNSEMQIFPNPTSENISVQFPNFGMKNITLEVIDLNGQVIQTANFSTSKANVNTSKLSNGIYFLRFTANDEIITKKFIKTSSYESY